MRLGGLGGLAVALGALLAASPASAAELLRKNVSAGSAVDRSCTERKLSGGSGYAQQTVVMPAPGAVTARLTAASGDWDLSVFEADSGQVVAGSAYRGSREVAPGGPAGDLDALLRAARGHDPLGQAGVRRPRRAPLAGPSERLPHSPLGRAGRAIPSRTRC